MVSTRQMATSGNGAQQQQNNQAANNTVDETVRLFYVTRQASSSNYLLLNTSMIGSPSLRTISHSITRNSTNRRDSDDDDKPSCSRPKVSSSNNGKNLLDLPQEVLEHILSYVSYKNVGQLRSVSHQMNNVCMNILNSTFNKQITLTYNRFQCIKANMPRRESARRNHPLSCESDIIETCYMRLSLLQMTFGKHIERNHCCFFPGGILDEVYTILNYIKNTPVLERPYRVTDELFDLSTMAMEYFKDRIEPTLPGIAFNKDFYTMPSITQRSNLPLAVDIESDSSSSLPSPPQSNMVLRKGIRKIKQGMKIYNNQLSVLRTELRSCKRKTAEQTKQLAEQMKLYAEQQKQTLEFANRFDEIDKKNEEMSHKFSTLLQELNKCKTELQYWRSKSPAVPICSACGQKVVPMLPSEDIQALINQGVKPEDLLNVNEMSVENNSNQTNSPTDTGFVYPDEATTSKLIAITSNKNKRQHAMSTTVDEGNANTSQQETNDNTDTSVTFTKFCGNQCGNNTEKVKDNETPPVNGGVSNTINSVGYSPQLFYGHNTSHKGVIVSTATIEKPEATVALTDSVAILESGSSVSNVAGGAINNAAFIETNGGGTEDVISLQGITSHETKKARRVQKAMRCVNVSGKRSK
ncbi:uncharacterized protein LOC119679736 [Teleopsis dalmanni]|uniref:uncharacterized protein LOC119679523 n=1 Tax=Teleopsis dalmanni TaxID=139649 RepID=UPI0018CDEE7F|nr:uncharacterized protein LOC119679523 [Teleopsis dalmanni]XP_037947850.1 uncharacterized protein LOC119679523 [Teleopsis dalmanni]XP_037948166.1 uncharacterized protein LOC119679736 [Teleopsis dalmanni]XP_037948167.1 uncharacterized protein LOC119679736 [Teleopsis dalmanni]